MDYEFWEFMFAHMDEIFELILASGATLVMCTVLIGLFKLFFFDDI